MGYEMVEGSYAAPPNIASNNKNLQDMKNKITKSNARANKYEAETKILGQKINRLSQNLVTAARTIQNTEEKVYDTEDRLDVLNRQADSLKLNLKSRYKQMTKTLAAMQRLSQQPAELVSFRPEKAINSLRSASLLRILQPKLKERADIIQKDISQLVIIRDQITEEHKALQKTLAALTAEQIAMNQLLEKRRLKQKELRKATRQERKKLKQFARKAKDLQDLLARIKREDLARHKREKLALAEREKAAEAAANRLTDKPKDNRPTAPIVNAKKDLDSLANERFSFKKAKGTIPLPARGYIRRTFGAKTPEGQASEGIIIRTLPHATVISPHDGRIVFAGKFRSYGLLLIISHGPEYHTLLAGMTRLDAEVGQWVLKGEPIGKMAKKITEQPKNIKLANVNSGAKNKKNSVGQNLYIELRKMGKPINPLPWIMAQDRKVL